MRDAIGGTQRHSEATKRQSRGNQEAIKRRSRGNQEALRGTQRHSEGTQRALRGPSPGIAAGRMSRVLPGVTLRSPGNLRADLRCRHRTRPVGRREGRRGEHLHAADLDPRTRGQIEIEIGAGRIWPRSQSQSQSQSPSRGQNPYLSLEAEKFNLNLNLNLKLNLEARSPTFLSRPRSWRSSLISASSGRLRT